MKHKTIIRLITLGDSNAGKSCIINYFVEKKFTAKANTVGVDFYSKEYMGKWLTIALASKLKGLDFIFSAYTKSFWLIVKSSWTLE